MRVKLESETQFDSAWLREVCQAALNQYVTRPGTFRVKVLRARTRGTLRYGKHGFVLVLPPACTQRSVLWLIHLGALYAGGSEVENLKQLHRERGDDAFPLTWVPDPIRLPLVVTDLPVPLEELVPAPEQTAAAKHEVKLSHARAMLARATTRAKRAETLRKKWANRVKRLERANAKAEG